MIAAHKVRKRVISSFYVCACRIVCVVRVALLLLQQFCVFVCLCVFQPLCAKPFCQLCVVRVCSALVRAYTIYLLCCWLAGIIERATKAGAVRTCNFQTARPRAEVCLFCCSFGTDHVSDSLRQCVRARLRFVCTHFHNRAIEL